MPSTTLPAPLAAFHASAPYRTAVQDILSRREAQRRTVAFSDPEKLAEVPLNVLPQKTRDAFRADHADHELNALRNRYSDIVPYDATRVTLGQRSPEQSYINASWLQEPNSTSPRRWIASQAPTQETVHDFLSLFLQTPGSSGPISSPPASPPKVILMLTACREGGREKSARYWPKKVGESVTFSQYIPNIVKDAVSRYSRPEVEWQAGPQPPISVTFVSSKPASTEDEKHHRGWRTNELSLVSGNTQKTIYQVEYLGWQDHGVPDSPHEVLRLLEHIDSLLESTKEEGQQGSLVAHCSAGVGRTGSFIAVAWLARLLEDLANAGQSRLSELEQHAQQSALGPLPVVPSSISSSHTAEKARGLLPSFLQKDNDQQTQRKTLQDFDFVMATIDSLRDQRTTMVQTPKQVEFVYEVARVWWEENAT